MTSRAILGGLVSLFMLLTVAQASTSTVVGCNVKDRKYNYDAFELYWEWGTIVDPPPTGFRVKVGTVANIYTITKDLPPTQFSIPFSALTAGPGAFYAVVIPMYGTKEGVVSDSCFFDSGRASLGLGVRRSP